MDFTFNEDQLLFQESVREFLGNEITPERLRSAWDTDTGRDPGLWAQLADLGLAGLTVPEEHGGLGMNALDFVLLAQECGYVALAEPLVNHALAGVPLLQDLGGALAEIWLPKAASGEARIIAALEQNLLVEDAHVADLLLLERAGQWYALTQGEFSLQHNASVDPSRRLFTVTVNEAVQPVASDDQARRLRLATLNRGAIGCAAQALGLAQRMVDMSVLYTRDRQQFGKPIGSFQAVKHHLANVAVRLEYAKAPVHRAAYAVADDAAGAAQAVSQAKLMACEAAGLAAKNSIQVHGAMGYTWEVDLHIFMKKAWVLANTWGDAGFHKQQVAGHIFADDAVLGAGATFQ